MRQKTKSRIGLDVSAATIKAVEIEADESAFKLVKASIKELDTPSEDSPAEAEVALAQKLAEVCQDFNASKKQVVAGISGTAVIVKKIVVDKSDDGDLREAVRLEAESQIPYDLSEVVYDFQPLTTDPTGKQVDVLLVAAKKESIEARLRVLTAARINPVVIDVDSFAIQNALEANYKLAPEEVVILADVGAQSTCLNIVQGGIPCFVTQVACGGDTLLRMLKMQHNIDKDEAHKLLLGDAPCPDNVQREIATVFQDLSTGIERALAFLKSSGQKATASRLLLSGGCAGWKPLVSYLAEHNHLTVEVLNPLQCIECSPEASAGIDLERVAPQLAVAVGFALRTGSDK